MASPAQAQQLLQRPSVAVAPQFMRITNRFLQRPEGGVQREMEYVVRNNGKGDLGTVDVPLPYFLPNLCVLDEDGSRLNFLSATEQGRQRPGAAAKGGEVLTIRFPAIKSGEVRSLLLRFEEAHDAPPKRWSLFTIPEQTVDLWVPDLQDEYFLVLSAAPDYVVKPERRVRKLKFNWRSKAHADGAAVFEKGCYTLSAQFGRTTRRENFRCAFVPNRRGTLWMHRLFFWFATAVGAAAALLPLLPLGAALAGREETLGGLCAFLAASGLGVIFSSTDAWMERFKFWVLWPILLNLAAASLHFRLFGL